MKRLNIIAVFDKDCTKVLMCLRRKEPYKGKYNFVGGKLKPGEDSVTAAYRELFEETSITREHISLKHIIDFVYHYADITLELFVGRLNTDVSIYGEENELHWIPLETDFFDIDTFAGEGNIGHMMLLIHRSREELL